MALRFIGIGFWNWSPPGYAEMMSFRAGGEASGKFPLSHSQYISYGNQLDYTAIILVTGVHGAIATRMALESGDIKI